ncbi:unnamed protein product, partial [Ectocarpus sp. 12 AP-2014]
SVSPPPSPFKKRLPARRAALLINSMFSWATTAIPSFCRLCRAGSWCPSSFSSLASVARLLVLLRPNRLLLSLPLPLFLVGVRLVSLTRLGAAASSAPSLLLTSSQLS